MNLPALVIVLVVISILLRGTKGAAKANNFIVMLKVAAIIFVIVAGAFFIDPVNWTPFIPAQTVITENGVSHNAYGVAGIARPQPHPQPTDRPIRCGKHMAGADSGPCAIRRQC